MTSALMVHEKTVVTLAYELRDPNGKMLDERSAQNPCVFICGLNQVLPALERALLGQTKGFTRELTLSPREAYGEYNKSLVVEVPRSMFPANIAIKKGMRFNTMGPADEPITVEVMDAQGDQVLLDGNHPLAGVELHFQLRLLDVRMATPEELKSQQVTATSTPTYH